MNKIEVKILNPHAVIEAEKMMVAMARLTQRGHAIQCLEDFEKLLERPYNDALVGSLVDLPHPTIQKFGVINIIVVGASRRFLAQITRHQNEVKFMSGSLQYSDYSDKAKFVVPYELLNDKALVDKYLESCLTSLKTYKRLCEASGNDAAGYSMPQGMRNVLLISATPYQFKHMIQQRTCNRNTLETQYVMLLIWEQLFSLSVMFQNCGPMCSIDYCKEGPMCCGAPYKKYITPTELLDIRFELIRKCNHNI